MTVVKMCKYNTCPRRDDCYRYMAIPEEKGQIYGPFKWSETNACSEFLPIDDSRQDIRRKEWREKHMV